MMEHGPNNTKLEKLMEDPQKQEEFIEELRKSQLFLPVIFSENMIMMLVSSQFLPWTSTAISTCPVQQVLPAAYLTRRTLLFLK